MTPQDLDRLFLALPYGRLHGTTIPKLAHFLGWPLDGRKVRSGIRRLRREQHVKVVTLPMAGGVFIVADDLDLAALKHTRDSLHSRAMSLHVTVRDLDECIADIEWSPTLFAEVA